MYLLSCSKNILQWTEKELQSIWTKILYHQIKSIYKYSPDGLLYRKNFLFVMNIYKCRVEFITIRAFHSLANKKIFEIMITDL